MKSLPKDYQIVMKEIEDFLWNFASGSGMDMIKVLTDVLEIFESSAQEGMDVLDVVGQDVGGFCDDLLKEIQNSNMDGAKKRTIERKHS